MQAASYRLQVRGFKNRGYLNSSIFLLVLFFVHSVFSSTSVLAGEWDFKQKSRHFVVYYQKEPYPGYVQEVISAAESYYKTIMENLGFRRFDFWTWDRRCKIFLYSSQETYYNETKQPPWSAGAVRIRKRQIHTHIYGEDFIESILPHEMGHLIFREFVGYDRRLPLWLDEGVAVLNEGKYKLKRLHFARGLVKSELFIPLQRLTRMNSVKTILMPTVFYSEAASVVDFLLTEFGRERFLQFCRGIRDGDDWQEAATRTYGFKDISEMNEKWVEFLAK